MKPRHVAPRPEPAPPPGLPEDWDATRYSAPALLVVWYQHARRDLPWRKTRDPWAIWVSEIMLQQTQVVTAAPYYARFMARFPRVQDAAQADLQDVLNLWAGLGYYRRAKHLYAAAKHVTEQLAGRIPTSAEGLRALPGIGRYTAAAIASIAWDEPIAVLDGNVMRVLARLAAVEAPLTQSQTQKLLWFMA
jgi:A/G-specific adenine glycosylase